MTTAGLLGVTASPAMAAGPICGTFERAPVSGGAYVVQNNAWGNTAIQCVQPRDGGFTITRAEGDLEFGGAPKSYPSIFAGEHYGEGSNTASLPVKVSQIGSARTSAKITKAPGAWNAAWDIWVNSSPDSPEENDDTEIMVWANQQGGPTPIGTKVDTITVEGRAYDVWKGAGPGGTDVVSYVDVKTTTAPDIPLAPFLANAIKRGATSPDSYVTSVQFGFEPWKGGTGLAVDNFTYTSNAPSPAPAPTPQPEPAPAPAPAPQPDPSPAPQPGSPGRSGTLVQAASGRCADVAGRSTAPGAPVQLWDCQGDNDAQRWTRSGKAVVNVGSGLCLDVANNSTSAGARVQQWTCTSGAPGQQWQAGPNATVVNPASGLCLDVDGGRGDNAARLILSQCQAGASSQSWTVR